ncbi:MAG: Smr/MutS family protein, partial [Bacteroidales bacterium]|nr:Smr/MutS family protein [Bacteroidales bacterium]
PPKQKVEIPKPAIEEIDLHRENLLDKFTHLSNGEIVAIQIARFRTTLETAILHRTKKIVFIHGVGNGKLKHEIRNILDTEYRSKARYQDASFKEYGYGATMVLVK